MTASVTCANVLLIPYFLWVAVHKVWIDGVFDIQEPLPEEQTATLIGIYVTYISFGAFITAAIVLLIMNNWRQCLNTGLMQLGITHRQTQIITISPRDNGDTDDNNDWQSDPTFDNAKQHHALDSSSTNQTTMNKLWGFSVTHRGLDPAERRAKKKAKEDAQKKVADAAKQEAWAVTQQVCGWIHRWIQRLIVSWTSCWCCCPDGMDQEIVQFLHEVQDRKNSPARSVTREPGTDGKETIMSVVAAVGAAKRWYAATASHKTSNIFLDTKVQAAEAGIDEQDQGSDDAALNAKKTPQKKP